MPAPPEEEQDMDPYDMERDHDMDMVVEAAAPGHVRMPSAMTKAQLLVGVGTMLSM